MKKHFIVFFFTTLFLISGGCAYTNPQNAQNTQTSSVASTAHTTTTESEPFAATSTPTLIDKPISEWPRYEFKELGFSIQLPFVSSSIVSNYEHCDVKNNIGKFCESELPYWYLNVYSDSPGFYLRGRSKNYADGSEWTLLDLFSLTIKNNKYFADTIELIPVHTYRSSGNPIILYDATKSYYGNPKYFGAHSDYLPSSEPEYNIIFSIKHPQIPVVNISFRDEVIHLDTIKKIAESIKIQ
jgi:hypothetical protein